MKQAKFLFALAFGAFPLAAAADYFGVFKAPRAGFSSSDIYSFTTAPLEGLAPTPVSDQTFKLKLGYKYSRYLSVESEFVDAGRNAPDIFASPGNLSSAFRTSSFGLDTVATLPVWRFSFYGRMGAFHGDARNAFGQYSTSLLSDNAARGSRWRYGLGMRYDITKSLDVRAEMERYSPMGSSLAGEPDSDLFSVGLKWRF